MADPKSSRRLTAILWFVASGLASTAVGIRFAADRQMNWALVAGALFCLIMGIAALAGNRKSPPTA